VRRATRANAKINNKRGGIISDRQFSDRRKARVNREEYKSRGLIKSVQKANDVKSVSVGALCKMKD